MSVGCGMEEVSRFDSFGTEANGRTPRAELMVKQGNANDIESAWLQAGDGDGSLVDRYGVNHGAIKVDLVLQLATVFRLLRQTPVDDGAIRFDTGKVDGRGGRDVKAKEIRKIVERFVEHLRRTIDKPKKVVLVSV